jgi:lysophospholipase L1-like esterase
VQIVKSVYEVTDRYDHENRMLVMIGTNNCHLTSQDAMNAANWPALQAFLDEIQAEGSRVTPMTITPRTSAWSQAIRTCIADMNTAIKAYGAARGITVVDAFAALSDGNGSLAPAYDSGDGLHPNQAGQDALAAAIIAAGFPRP